jgi:hypothetical protein
LERRLLGHYWVTIWNVILLVALPSILLMNRTYFSFSGDTSLATRIFRVLALHANKEKTSMANLTIRNLNEEIKARLRIMAARHGRSMEEEARHILRQAVTPQAQDERGLGSRIVNRFSPVGGCNLPTPERSETPRSPDFKG